MNASEQSSPVATDPVEPPRCDRCGSRARYLAVLYVVGEFHDLLFCGHHGRHHRVALEDQGAVISDIGE